MENNELKTLLTLANYFLGALIFIFSIGFYFKNKSLAPLFILLAIIVVGPVENLLMKMAPPKDRWKVDQLTSLGMLVLLLTAVFQSQNEQYI
ncbi:MAG: hypothetical protein PWQ97_876 [Tepidanaerobacteraceae bacterium]|nr:hypothetical protein [Tepidanaerobacteraceae bacterium]